MKKQLKQISILSVIFLILSSSVYSQSSYNSLLWKIEGNGLEEPSYLYGTIHIIPKDDFQMGPGLRSAITSSDVLVMEMDLDMSGMMSAMQKMMMPEGKTLEDYLTESQYDSLETFLKDTIGASGMQLTMTKRMKPFYIAQTFYKDILGEEPMSFELTFKRMADSLKMEIIGLEKMEEQIAMLDSIPIETQVEMLMEGVRNYNEMKTEFRKMVAIYNSQDLESLQSFMDESAEEFMEFESLLLDNRNEKWITSLNEMMGDEQYFIAVGAAHLPGENGVINLLREEGYTVTPVSTK